MQLLLKRALLNYRFTAECRDNYKSVPSRVLLHVHNVLAKGRAQVNRGKSLLKK